MLVREPVPFISFELAYVKGNQTVDSSSAFFKASGGKGGQTAVDMLESYAGCRKKRWSAELQLDSDDSAVQAVKSLSSSQHHPSSNI